MPKKSGAEILVEGLQRWGLSTIYGLPGVHLDHLYDALHGARDRIRAISSRHEQGAAYMAYGSAMATGRPSALAVVPGPGLLNAAAGISTAYAANAPVLCIVGRVTKPLRDKGYGGLHELPDQTGIVARLTKWSERVERAADMASLVDEAFVAMLSGRPRPVALEVGPEVLAERIRFSGFGPKPDIVAPKLDVEAVARAADLIADARNPVIIVGGGAQHAASEVRRLAEATGAPVVSRQMGRGVLPDAHPLSISAYAMNSVWADVDVAIALGTRFQQQREWGLDDAIKLIRVDIDPEEMDRISRPAVGIVADAREGAAALADATLAKKGAGKGRSPRALAPIRSAFSARIEKEIPLQKAYLDVLREMLPDDGVLVDEITQVGHAAKFAMPVHRPRSLITSGYQGTLGYGFATAIGVKAALGDRVVFSINGDGGLLYTLSELATAVQNDIALVAVVFNDNCFGNVQEIQKRWFGGRTIASDLRNPDFALLARSFGALGLRVEGPTDLREALRFVLAQKRPALIEVAVEKGAMGWVWDIIEPRKMRGQGAGASPPSDNS